VLGTSFLYGVGLRGNLCLLVGHPRKSFQVLSSVSLKSKQRLSRVVLSKTIRTHGHVQLIKHSLFVVAKTAGRRLYHRARLRKILNANLVARFV